MDGYTAAGAVSLATAVYVGGRPLLLIFEWWQSTNVRPAKAWMVSMRPSSPIGLHFFLSFLSDGGLGTLPLVDYSFHTCTHAHTATSKLPFYSL